jgi:3',5'-cyclic AMP phosphodiesterase CpdA
MLRKILIALVFLCAGLLAAAQITIAQISDTHLGLKRAPEAASNLRRVVEMVNQRPPDAVIISGDIGENPGAWKEARAILSKVRAPVYYVPGNHDDSANSVDRYRSVFGKNYYEFKVKNATFFALDSQLLGNFDVFESRQIMPLSAIGQAESAKMLDWLSKEIDGMQERSAQTRGGAAAEPGLVFVVQHVPISRNGGFPPDAKPYWTVQEPYRSRELELLRRLGVKHVFAGHWHAGMVFQADGITYHLVPATSWSPFDHPLGFAMHSISANGDVKTEFVSLR